MRKPKNHLVKVEDRSGSTTTTTKVNNVKVPSRLEFRVPHSTEIPALIPTHWHFRYLDGGIKYQRKYSILDLNYDIILDLDSDFLMV